MDRPVSDAGDIRALLASARAGSPTALGQLLDRFRHYLLTVADQELVAELKAKAGASDVVQDTFLEAQRLFARFTGEDPDELRPWLRAILRNKLADVRRQYHGVQKRQVGREHSLQANPVDTAVPEPATATDSSPSGTAIRNEEEELLTRALERLPDHYREVIRLRNWEDLSFLEIGLRLQRSEEAARMLWTRAVERLQQELEGSS